MPLRAETVRGYVQGMHQLSRLADAAESRADRRRRASLATIETRFRYNPDVKSLVAMVPGVIPLLLMLIPAMLTALGVVREKELGSIINFYVTPTTRLEFLLGKQLPYVVVGDGQLPDCSRCSRSPCSACRSRAASRPSPRRRCSTSARRPAIGLLISTLHAQPDRRDLRHRDPHHPARRAVLRAASIRSRRSRAPAR